MSSHSGVEHLLCRDSIRAYGAGHREDEIRRYSHVDGVWKVANDFDDGIRGLADDENVVRVDREGKAVGDDAGGDPKGEGRHCGGRGKAGAEIIWWRE